MKSCTHALARGRRACTRSSRPGAHGASLRIVSIAVSSKRLPSSATRVAMRAGGTWYFASRRNRCHPHVHVPSGQASRARLDRAAHDRRGEVEQPSTTDFPADDGAAPTTTAQCLDVDTEALGARGRGTRGCLPDGGEGGGTRLAGRRDGCDFESARVSAAQRATSASVIGSRIVLCHSSGLDPLDRWFDRSGRVVRTPRVVRLDRESLGPPMIASSGAARDRFFFYRQDVDTLPLSPTVR